MAKIMQRVTNLEKHTGGADPEPLVIMYVNDWPHGHEPAPDDPGLDALASAKGWEKIGPCTYEVRPGGGRR